MSQNQTDTVRNPADHGLSDTVLIRILKIDIVISIIGILGAALDLPAPSFPLFLNNVWFGFLAANTLLWSSIAVIGTIYLLAQAKPTQTAAPARPLTLDNLRALGAVNLEPDGDLRPQAAAPQPETRHAKPRPQAVVPQFEETGIPA